MTDYGSMKASPIIAPVLQTDRLMLRPHRPDDLDDCFAMMSDPQVMRHIKGPPPSREDIWNRIMRYSGVWHIFGLGMFAVFEAATQHYVGDVGFGHFGRGLGADFDGYPEAAWMLNTAHQGKGYASEAVAKAHDWLEQTHPYHRTVCIIAPDNLPSNAIAAKLGYHKFATAHYKGAELILHHKVIA